MSVNLLASQTRVSTLRSLRSQVRSLHRPLPGTISPAPSTQRNPERKESSKTLVAIFSCRSFCRSFCLVLPRFPSFWTPLSETFRKVGAPLFAAALLLLFLPACSRGGEVDCQGFRHGDPGEGKP